MAVGLAQTSQRLKPPEASDMQFTHFFHAFCRLAAHVVPVAATSYTSDLQLEATAGHTRRRHSPLSNVSMAVVGGSFALNLKKKIPCKKYHLFILKFYFTL